jgi:L-lactate dehydrogenase complex protein LldE
MRPRIGFATRRLLERAGRQVMVPLTQTCCGQPGYNSGDTQSAKALALKVMHEFENYDYVVAPFGSCAGMIREHYLELFSDSPQHQEEIKRVVQRTYEPTDFLANVAKLESISDPFNGTITYHDSCSGLRELGVKDQPHRLLAKIPGLKHRRCLRRRGTIRPVCCMSRKCWLERERAEAGRFKPPEKRSSFPLLTRS